MGKYRIGCGSKILNKKSCVIDKGVVIGRNVLIYGNNHILGDTIIGDNTIIMPNNYIINSKVGDNCIINNSVIENSKIHNLVQIGPFSRIRPNSEIESGCKIGNFVEVKNSKLGKGTKASHLAYVGDAEIGEKCNIGCGVIFANYNGKEKNKIIVGNNCFIGSNSNLIAPVKIDNNCYICAGSNITKDLNEYDFAIGRVRQEVKPNRAIKYLKTIY